MWENVAAFLAKHPRRVFAHRFLRIIFDYFFIFGAGRRCLLRAARLVLDSSFVLRRLPLTSLEIESHTLTPHTTAHVG
jgi:hypothetical protein